MNLTHEQISDVRRLLSMKHSARGIAAKLGLPRNALTQFVEELKQDPALDVSAWLKTQTRDVRPCLCCRKDFQSAHAGNRLCPTCSIRSRDSGLPQSIQQASVW